MPAISYIRRFRAAYRRASHALATAALASLSSPALASASGGGGLPWEDPLQTVVDSITGPVAFSVSVIGIVVAGATLIWGGEVSGFARTLLFIVLVIALIVGAVNILSTLFGVGAVV